MIPGLIPGSNVLRIAFQVIAKQKITYYQYAGRSINLIGYEVTQYRPGIHIRGSFQPVPRVLYAQYGLDLEKSYYTFYTLKNLLPIQRDVSGDQLVFGNERFQCQSSNDWFHIDGWTGILCVRINSVEVYFNTLGGPPCGDYCYPTEGQPLKLLGEGSLLCFGTLND